MVNIKQNECPTEKLEEQLKRHEVDRDMSKLQPHIMKATATLGIDLPPIVIVPYLSYALPQWAVLDEYNPAFGAKYSAGVNFLPLENLIVMTNRSALRAALLYEGAPEAFKMPDVFPDSVFLFSLLHELRHSWQYKHAREDFYSGPNARGDSYLTDISEIDADAFALAYYRHCTTFSIPSDIELILKQDDGRRDKLARIYEKQLFGSIRKGNKGKKKSRRKSSGKQFHRNKSKRK